jgi:PAS domain S-box-containing protein
LGIRHSGDEIIILCGIKLLSGYGLGTAKKKMAGDAYIQQRNDGRRYEAVLRLSEALSVCTEPEDLTKILSEQLCEFLDFLQFYIIVYKEKSLEIEWAVVGREKSLMAAYADVPVEQRPSWQAYATQEPFHIRDWKGDERVPARLKQGIAAQGLDVGPLVFVPLTTPHRRLGALGMSGAPGIVYSTDDVSFLRLIGRVVAFAIDDNFNLRRAEVAHRELQHQNERLQSSERELREVIETIPTMTWSAGADGAAEFFNGRWLAYVGLTADQARGWGWTVAVHPDDLKRLVDYWQAIMASGRSGEIEGRLRRFDGVYRWFLFRATPSLDGNGRVVKWYGTNTDIEERKRAEDALKRSEAYLAEAQRVTHTGSCAVDGASREILYWSEEMFRIYSFDPQYGLPTWDQWIERIHPEDRDKFRTAGDKTFLEKTNCDVEFRIMRLDGTFKHIHAIAHPVLNPDGKLVQVVGTMVDITERLHTEESLRRSESYLAQAQRLAHIGSWAWDIPGRNAIYISEEWYRMYGFDPSDGMPSWEQELQRVHPEDRSRFRATLDRAIAEKSDYDMEFRILPPHSPGRYIHSVGHPVLGPSEELLQFVGVSMDITESKQAEEAFRLIVVGTAATTGNDFFQSLVQHLAQGLHARYAFVTACDDQKHARTLAFWKGDGFGENFEFDIADTPCEKVLRGELCHYRQGLRGLFPLDKVLADWQAESYLALPMLDGSSRVIGHIAILDDRPMEADVRAIDLLKIFAFRAAAELKRQRAEDELRAALQERERLRRAQAELAHFSRVSTMGELTASLAHEIKQPIGAAVTNAESSLRLLNREHPDIAEAREAALEMVRDARRAADIIDRVRSLYQKGSSQLDAVDINEVVGEIVVMLQNEAKRRSVMVRTDLAGGLPEVMADRVQLQQILMNLMLNGIEAMRETSGELSIKSQLAEDGQLLISVTDAGVGLPTENPDQIFTPFFTTKSQGTGLGLAITRSIVESHGGRIWATANLGRGATFHFTLPSRVAVAA